MCIRDRAIHAHVADYLLKPIDPSKLEDILRKTCRRVEEKRRLELNIKDPIDRIFVGAIKKTPSNQMRELFCMYNRLFPQNGLWISMICLGKGQGEIYDGGIQKNLNDMCFQAPFKARVRPYNESRGMFGLLIFCLLYTSHNQMPLLIILTIKIHLTQWNCNWLSQD